MMKKFDDATAGRLQPATCKEIEERVLNRNQLVVVFFGPEEFTWRTGNYSQLNEAVSLDRGRNIEEPIVFVQNDDR